MLYKREGFYGKKGWGKGAIHKSLERIIFRPEHLGEKKPRMVREKVFFIKQIDSFFYGFI